MKKFSYLLLVILISQIAKAQEQTNQRSDHQWIYPSLNLLVAVPTNEFKEAIDKATLWGFNFDVATRPFKHATFIQPGAQVEFLFPGSRTDEWSGIEVTTTSVMFNTNLMTRIKLWEGAMVSPFIEGAYGLKISSVSSSFTVVDEATFLEEFLLGQEDEYEEHVLNEHYDFSQNFSLGIGCVIKRIFSLQIKYNFGPEIEFIKKEDIRVINNEFSYDISSSPYQTVAIAIGFSFELAASQQ